MLELMRARRRELDAWLAESGQTHTISLASNLLHREVRARLEQHAFSPLLDVGSGRCPFREELRARDIELITLDIEDRSGDVDHLGDVQDMAVIENGSIGTVLCTQVLEHVPRPWDALREIARVLRPGGALLLTVPHLTPIHEAPNDYFRFTRFGLRSLARDAGLDVLEVAEVGGLLAFLGHPASVLLLELSGAVPGLQRAGWGANFAALVKLLDPLDRMLGLRSIFPCNYILVARRPLAASPRRAAGSEGARE